MISPRTTTVTTSMLTLLLLAFTCSRFSLTSGQQLGDPSGQQAAINHHNIPGHFEFEVAPKMEPPAVRKPPYPQSAQLCPGSADPFARFSPSNTLCGDLNQGRVPLNPLGQMIDDQSYPFELIKNKTLQFLARALPVLKLEYETIPKVARYLPANHLLNPTHQASPLASDHLHQLNQRLAANGMDASAALVDQLDRHMQQAPPIYLRRRRRSALHDQQRVAAELVSNASIVVKSAHSGRIHSAAWNNSEPSVGVFTKPKTSNKSQAEKPTQQQTNHSGNNWAPSGHNTAAPISGEGGGKSAKSAQTVAAAAAAAAVVVGQSDAATQAANATSSATNNNGGDRKQRNGSLASHSARQPSGVGGEFASSHAAPTASMSHDHPDNKQPLVAARSSPSNGADSQSSASASASGASNKQTARHRAAACGESAGALTSAVCQMAAALIEGDRPPVWLQLAKHLGAAYSGASPDSPLLPGPTLWSLLGNLAMSSPTGQQDSSPAKSSQSSSVRTSGSSAASSLMSVLGPLTTLLTGGGSSSAGPTDVQAKESTSNRHHDLSTKDQQPQTLAAALGSSTMAKLAVAGWASNALVSLVEYFVPSVYQSISSLAGGGGARSFAKRKKPFDPQEQFVDTPASMAANLKAAGGAFAAPGKQPPTPCPSVEEYISPTFARNYQGAWKYVVQIPHEGYFTQTIQRTSCVRQRCEFTEGVCHESPRWVSLLVAEIYYPNTIFGAGEQANSVAADTLAVQHANVPAPQLATSSSTSSVQQVAMNAQQPAVAARQTHHQQQVQKQHSFGSDPLQMTDTYNHNLQNAFIDVANQLGWDPNNVANMQHLANAYNYQLMQRSGLSPGNNLQTTSQGRQQPTLESRSSSATTANYMQQQQQQQQQQPSSNLNNDYIMALAEATLQQNPNMSIQELIMSLRQQTQQLQQMSALNRKRRDTNSMGNQQQAAARRQIQTMTSSQQAQHRSSNLAENGPSINDIAAPGMNGGQFAAALDKQLMGSAQQQQQQQQQQQGSSSLQTQLLAQHQAGPPDAQVGGAGQINQGAGAHATGQDGQQGADPTNANQVECDGHDRLGCYVVRVYYDWFLVNGSCKCWKTGQQTGSAGGSQSSSSTNSFLRRIFTG